MESARSTMAQRPNESGHFVLAGLPVEVQRLQISAKGYASVN